MTTSENSKATARRQRKSEKKPDFANAIHDGRTYTADELEVVIPCDHTFLSQLTYLHGLLPRGLNKWNYHGKNVNEALDNHAEGKMVRPRRNPISREKARTLIRDLKSEKKTWDEIDTRK